MKADVRQAEPRDCANLCALLDEVDSLHRGHLPQIFQHPEGHVRSTEHLLGLMADRNVGLFVAEAQGQLLGLVHVTLVDTPQVPILVPRRYATIENLAVQREHQRAGIGRALLHRAEQWARGRGATSIELNVYEFNREAIAFYRRLGYETLSRRMHRLLSGIDDAG